ncbi:6268_t:CDS:2, partial [Dentiscutata heterogama]
LKYILSYNIQKDADCDECKKANNKINEFENYLKEENNQKFCIENKKTIDNYIELNRQSASSKFVHIVEANFIRKGYSSQFLNIINKALEDIRNKSNGKFSDDEITQKIIEIWNLLRNNISLNYPVTSIEDAINSEVKSAYPSWMPIENKYKDGTIPALHDFGLITKLVLPKQDIDIIEEKLDNLTDLILRGKPQHFYNGIVNDLKSKIEKTFSDNSRFFKAFPLFKRQAHIYAFLKFKLKLKEYQKIWDEENHPLCILDQKKEEYSNIIKARLQHESTLVSEAYIVADYLLRVIHKKAMKAGNCALKDAIKKIPWLTRTETVRLKYFEELANEVQNGYKENALNHFKNPKHHFENWFKFIIDNVVDENPEHKYNDTFKKEINESIDRGRISQEAYRSLARIDESLIKAGAVYDMRQEITCRPITEEPDITDPIIVFNIVTTIGKGEH